MRSRLQPVPDGAIGRRRKKLIEVFTYWLEIGKDEKALLDIARRQNGPVSERIQNAPDLLPGLQFYVDAFNVLTRSRQIGQGGIGPIPYGEISLYCKDEGIEGDDREDFIYVIGEIDRFYVDWQAKFVRKKLETPPSQPKTAPAVSKVKPRSSRRGR